MSRADTSHQAEGLAQQSDQSAFENSPVASKAGATSTTRKLFLDFTGELSFDDSKQIGIDIKVDSQMFAATATDADTVPNEDSNVRESNRSMRNSKLPLTRHGKRIAEFVGR